MFGRELGPSPFCQKTLQKWLSEKFQAMSALRVSVSYALAACFLVAVAIFNDYGARPANSFSFKPRGHGASHTIKKDPIYVQNLIEYGLFAEAQGGGISEDQPRYKLSNTDQGSDDVPRENTVASVFQQDPMHGDFPEWIPAFCQNVWSFLAIAIIISLIFTLLVLGQEKIVKKWAGWIKWVNDNDNVRRGLMVPQFPINVINGLFAVVGPLYIVRVLNLDVALLGALMFAEHATQVLTQRMCGKYVEEAGNKHAQRRAVLILAASTGMFTALPFLPEDLVEQVGSWTIFFWYATARMFFAWGTNQFDANYNAAINNSAFLPPQHVIRAMDLFYCSCMLGGFVGAVLALLITRAAGVTWILLLPAVLIAIMYVLVETIPQVLSPYPTLTSLIGTVEI
jgi:hypothetical protein